MFKYIIAGVIQYEGETKQQAIERYTLMQAHNEAVDRELEKWKPGPAKFYSKWLREHMTGDR